MLSAVIFLPLVGGLVVLALPAGRPDWARRVALATSLVELVLVAIVIAGFDRGRSGLQWRMDTAWIPSLGARYDVAVDGISLPLVALTALLAAVVMVYVLPQRDRVRGHAFLFLLMTTGLIGVFVSRDLLLFYLFFEVGLVPMYFIVGVWGHERRRYAALKFFLYTRAGSLAMLLSFLGTLPAYLPPDVLPGRHGRPSSPHRGGRRSRPARTGHRVRGEAAHRSPAQLAARRPRGGTHGGQRHARRGPAEDGGLRPGGRDAPGTPRDDTALRLGASWPWRFSPWSTGRWPRSRSAT